jgi:hypothetical protein
MKKLYINSKDTAKYIRKALKENFPNQKFYVRSDHNAINISWEDGPQRADVEEIAQQYQGGGFDGMIDLDFSQSHYLFEDGSIALHYRGGTVDSRGIVPEIDNRHLAAPAYKIVQFGARYIFCTRHITNFDNKYSAAVTWIRNNCIITGDTGHDKFDMFGNKSVADIARNMTWNHIKDQDLSKTLDQVQAGLI